MTTQSANQLKNEYVDIQDRLIVDFLAGLLDDRKDDVEAVLGDVLYSHCCNHRVTLSIWKAAANTVDRTSASPVVPPSPPQADNPSDDSVLYALVKESLELCGAVLIPKGSKVYGGLNQAQVGISLHGLEGYSVYKYSTNKSMRESQGWERHTMWEYYTTTDSRVLRPDQVLKFKTSHITRRDLVNEVERSLVSFGSEGSVFRYQFFLRVFEALKNGCGYEVGKLDTSSPSCEIPVSVETGSGRNPVWSNFNLRPPLILSTF